MVAICGTHTWISLVLLATSLKQRLSVFHVQPTQAETKIPAPLSHPQYYNPMFSEHSAHVPSVTQHSTSTIPLVAQGSHCEHCNLGGGGLPMVRDMFVFSLLLKEDVETSLTEKAISGENVIITVG